MPAITISRELGSQGRQIAKSTAQVLGYHFMDKSTIGMVLGEYGLVEFGREYEALPGFWERFDARRMERREEVINMLNRVILALARHGNIVILGRCGFAVLHGYTDVLNVRIQAPLHLRIAQVMNDHSFTDIKRAESFVKDNDQIRTAFIESFYGVRWDSATAFDLVIDTSKTSPEQATVWLVAAAKDLEQKKETDAKTTSTIPLDSTLNAAICEALHCSDTH